MENEKDIYYINDTLRLFKLDDRNIELQKVHHVEAGKVAPSGAISVERDEWRLIGYYPNVTSALKGAMERHMNDNLHRLIDSIVEFKESLNEITNIDKILK